MAEKLQIEKEEGRETNSESGDAQTGDYFGVIQHSVTTTVPKNPKAIRLFARRCSIALFRGFFFGTLGFTHFTKCLKWMPRQPFRCTGCPATGLLLTVTTKEEIERQKGVLRHNTFALRS